MYFHPMDEYTYYRWGYANNQRWCDRSASHFGRFAPQTRPLRCAICNYHVETTKIAKLSIHDNKINYMYEPFPYRKLIHLFKYYPFEEKDVFIDIGCGKGQTLKCQMNSWNSLPHGVRLRKRTVKIKHRAKRLHLSFWCKRDSWAA